jgi:putative ABC transport system substrate-binding protein
VIGGFKEDVQDGYFASLGSSRVEEWRLAADLTAAILNGAQPATVAVQQLTHIEVAVNVRTALELNIRVPKSILLRADRVIE